MPKWLAPRTANAWPSAFSPQFKKWKIRVVDRFSLILHDLENIPKHMNEQ